MTTHLQPCPREVEPLAVPDEDHSTSAAWHTPQLTAAVLPPHITPCPPEEQAAHLAQLAEAVSGFAVGVAIRRHSGTSPQGATDGK